MRSSHKKSSWYSSFAGVRFLVGRARHQASSLSAGLKKRGGEVIEIPFIEIRKPHSYKPLDTALKAIAEYDWLILTSVNGVEALSARMKHLRIPAKNLKRLQTAPIDPATLQTTENLELRLEAVPQRNITDAI